MKKVWQYWLLSMSIMSVCLAAGSFGDGQQPWGGHERGQNMVGDANSNPLDNHPNKKKDNSLAAGISAGLVLIACCFPAFAYCVIGMCYGYRCGLLDRGPVPGLPE